MNEIGSDLDGHYKAIRVLIKNECWKFLDDFYGNLTVRVWRTDINVLLIYATAGNAVRERIPSVSQFIKTCKKLHTEPELWKGLDD